MKQTAFPLLLALILTLTAGCSPKPGAPIAEQAITEHFAQRGYLVRDITIGRISSNPVAERQYMAPLTYVVEVPWIVLEHEAEAGDSTDTGTGEMMFIDATFKIQARRPPREGWVVSQVEGVNLSGVSFEALPGR